MFAEYADAYVEAYSIVFENSHESAMRMNYKIPNDQLYP